MSWQLAVLTILGLVLGGGFLWFERSRPSARVLAAVAAMAALGVAGRVALAPIPNVVATTDIVLLSGFALGGAPGFIIGALSALVSNFWLGQGPWTPWQMAGWGAVGLAGAGLGVLTRRQLGRWGLALAAALAAFAYGALMDLSVMVNFGGEQSLDRYLALSARGIPFNLAHAAGNATLMLVAGPVLVRMLERYRSRFEAHWLSPAEFDAAEPTPRASTAVAAVLAAFVLSTLALGPPTIDRASAAEPEAIAASAGSGGSGVSYLKRAQNGDGGWGASAGGSSNISMTAWASLGLEAAGRNPLDLKSGGSSAIDYLRKNSSAIDSNGDIELAILALEAAGLDSRSFAGRDLPGELLGRRRGDGSLEGQVNQTAYAVLALRAAGLRGEVLGRSAAWLRRAQNRDGGWGSVPKARSEADSTGATLQALAVAPGGGDLGKGAEWLASSQERDGSWALTKGAAGNSQSTAWVVQGLSAIGRDPGGVRSGGKSPLEYLAARQASDGHYSYSSGSDQTPVWVTAQALTGVNAAPFPLGRVERAPRGQSGDGGGAGTGINVGGGSGTGTRGFGGERFGPRRDRSAGAKAKRRAGGADRGGSLATDPRASPVELERTSLPIGSTPESGSGLPATTIFVGGLGVLALALGGGYLLYVRRLD